MPKGRRKESSTEIYHVIVKGINHEKIFNQAREKIYFKSIILRYLKKYKVEIYSYCIMSNHAHFMIRAEIQVLSLFMAVILAEYANYYNYKHHRNGHVFQNRFASECIENESYFWNCMRYIHLNPMKANMVKNMIRYKYSSIGELMAETPVIVSENVIAMYKKKFTDFQTFEEFHKLRTTEVFRDISSEMENQKLEVARTIAEELYETYALTLLNQVFEEKAVRVEYIRRLRKELKITEKRAKELCLNLMNQVQNE